VPGHRCILATIAVGFAAVALAPPAFAAAPVPVGSGSLPRVAVDAAGAGHVTWIESAGNTSTFHYCKLPATATGCSAPFAFADAEQDVDGGYALLPGDGRVLLVEARGVSPDRAKLLWTSTDGGATFGGPAQLATMSSIGPNIAGGAIYVSAGTLGLGAESIFTIGQLSGITAPFQASGTAAAATASQADLAPNVGAAVALQGDTLIAALSDFATLQWSRYAGPVPATPEALNTTANWTPPTSIGPRSAANTETSLVAGAGGAYVGYAVDAGAGQADFVIRRFDGAAWGTPTVVAKAASKPDLYEDPAGRLHALWTDAAGLRYRYTTDAANATWSAPQTVATGDSFGFPRLAVNAAGSGWAVWAGGAGVRAVPLKRATVYAGPQTSVTSTDSQATYKLGVPRGCVSPGQGFRVTLTWKRQKRKGNLFVKVRRADFYLQTKRLRADTAAPFAYTYDVKPTQRPGSTITLRARAFIKVRHGTSPKKSIRAKVRVCG
jgi:hypothetical protein